MTMARERIRISTRIWEDENWRALETDQQLFLIACMAVGADGACTDERIIKATGWDAGFVSVNRQALAGGVFEHLLIGNRKRRALPKRLAREVLERGGHKCAQCGSRDGLQIDHIFPVARGGSDDIDNLQVLCKPCNLRKGARVA
jgi:hypothetical protein